MIHFLSFLAQGRKFDFVKLVLALGSTIALLAIVSLTVHATCTVHGCVVVYMYHENGFYVVF